MSSEHSTEQPNVASIMSADVVSVEMDDPIARVVELFEENRFEHVVVLERGECVGVLSERDLLRELSPFIGTMRERSMDEFTGNKRVHQVMTRRPISVGPATPIADACRVMVLHRIHCLPVLDEGGRCVGVLTSSDIIEWTEQHLLRAGRSAA